jgi:hypothetical protein
MARNKNRECLLWCKLTANETVEQVKKFNKSGEILQIFQSIFNKKAFPIVTTVEASNSPENLRLVPHYCCTTDGCGNPLH